MWLAICCFNLWRLSSSPRTNIEVGIYDDVEIRPATKFFEFYAQLKLIGAALCRDGFHGDLIGVATSHNNAVHCNKTGLTPNTFSVFAAIVWTFLL